MGHHHFALEFGEGAHGFLGIHVHVAAGRRVVAADREERDVDRVALADFLEARKIGGVAAMKDGASIAVDDESTKSAMRICETRAPQWWQGVSETSSGPSFKSPNSGVREQC